MFWMRAYQLVEYHCHHIHLDFSANRNIQKSAIRQFFGGLNLEIETFIGKSAGGWAIAF